LKKKNNKNKVFSSVQNNAKNVQFLKNNPLKFLKIHFFGKNLNQKNHSKTDILKKGSHLPCLNPPNYHTKKKRYTSDLTDKQWKKIENLLPSSKSNNEKGGRPQSNMREVINAIFYLNYSGCTWRNLPKDFPNYQTVYGHFRHFKKDGTWEKISAELVKSTREKMGKTPLPTGGCIDSQSIKSTNIGGESIGYDGNKKINGRKRFILTDTIGLILGVYVCAANVSEIKGARKLFAKLKMNHVLSKLCENLKSVWADGGFRGEILSNFLRKIWNFILIITLVSDLKKQAEEKEKILQSKNGFVVIPKRWVVERTFAWLGNYRRLNKDYEKTTASSQTMILIASIQIMLKRIK
jgi:putative transposase